MSVDWGFVAEVFADASETPPEEREAFVARRCEGRPDDAAAVLRLLQAERQADAAFPGNVHDEVAGRAVREAARPPERVGAWRLVREIGRGGMGQVFLAERVEGEFEQRAAVKLLKRGMDSDAILERFLRERQILAGLDHPNIARLLDGGIAADGRPYFVMEHVDGEPITRWADRRGLTVDARIDLFRSVCHAVEYAHRNLVVHRDLKPSNILVTGDGTPKLLDFGIAKLLGPGAASAGAAETDAGLRLLTPEYAAPEQFRGGPITTVTDVYGAGAVLYELLSGARPRDAQPPDGSHESFEPPPVTVTAPVHLRRRLSGDLETIVATALRAAPERRYASVAALREDLRRHQERLPVRARPDTPLYRTSRFVRRHRAGVASGAAIALLLLAFAVTASVQAARIRRQAGAIAVERDRARHEAATAGRISDFLVGVFEVADPMHVGVGDSIRARDLLDRGAERIAADLAGEPLLEARLLGVIGNAYSNLGRGNDAERLVLRAAELQRDAGADSSAIAGMLRQLAWVRLRRGDAGGARAAVAQAMAVQAAAPPDDVARWETLVELAQVFHAAGDLDSARLVTARAMALFDSIPPDRFADARAALGLLSTLLGYSRDWDALERIHARMVATEGALAGPRSEPVATVYRVWARTRRLRGDTAAADSMLHLALEIHRGLGMRDVSAGGVLGDLSMIAASRGEIARADSLQAASIAVLSARLGDDHTMVIAARGQRAALLQRTGRVSEAIPVYRDVVAAYRRRDPPPPELPVAQWLLAEALRKAGRLDEARPVFAEALRAHEERFPPDYILTANVRRDYGRALIESGRPRDAVPILRQAVAVLARRWGEDDARTNDARVLLARAEGR